MISRIYDHISHTSYNGYLLLTWARAIVIPLFL